MPDTAARRQFARYLLGWARPPRITPLEAKARELHRLTGIPLARCRADLAEVRPHRSAVTILDNVDAMLEASNGARILAELERDGILTVHRAALEAGVVRFGDVPRVRLVPLVAGIPGRTLVDVPAGMVTTSEDR